MLLTDITCQRAHIKAGHVQRCILANLEKVENGSVAHGLDLEVGELLALGCVLLVQPLVIVVAA